MAKAEETALVERNSDLLKLPTPFGGLNLEKSIL